MEDLIGQKFGRLTIKEYHHRDKNRHKFYLCVCGCGNESIVDVAKLKSGHTQSCGCIRKEQVEDLVGQEFGLLTVLEFVESKKCGKIYRRYWKCLCKCGNEIIVRGDQLKDGGTRSCGCFKKDRSLIPPLDFTPEVALKKAKSVHCLLRKRCLNSDDIRYPDYGGRGIKVCDTWLGEHGFQNFLKDMGLPPSEKHQIDRIDNDGPYSSENCRWATNKENNWHKRDSHMLTLKGKTQCGSAWSEELGINKNTLWKRIRLGWSEEKTLTTPVDKRYSRI